MSAEMHDQIAALLPSREGHFVFESGHHGGLWLDLERLFLRPLRIEPLAKALAERLAAYQPEVVCGPLVEGAFVALGVAAALGVPFTYSEPQRNPQIKGLFTVAYPIPESLWDALRGRRVAIVNDVINAGSAVRGTLEALAQCGAEVVAIGTLAVYGDAASRLADKAGVALEALASFQAPIWEPSECPLCAKGLALS